MLRYVERWEVPGQFRRRPSCVESCGRCPAARRVSGASRVSHVLWRQARRSRLAIYPVSRRGAQADVDGLEVRRPCRGVWMCDGVESEAVTRAKQVFVPSHTPLSPVAAPRGEEASVESDAVGYPYIPHVLGT